VMRRRRFLVLLCYYYWMAGVNCFIIALGFRYTIGFTAGFFGITSSCVIFSRCGELFARVWQWQ